MAEEEKEIVLRTEEVNEILNASPRWILRWGLSVILILITVGVTLTYFIQYPDVLRAEITLTTLHPPVTLVAKTEGKLQFLLVKDKEHVALGQVIGVIENTARYTDVLLLDAKTDSLLNQINTSDSLPKIQLPSNLSVGTLTPQYLQVLKSLKDIYLYQTVNPYTRQIALLKHDLADYRALLSRYQNQQTISEEQLKLAETDYNRDKRLLEEKVISDREFENKKKDYLRALNDHEQQKINLSNIVIRINEVEKNILQLQIQDYEEQSRIKNELEQNLKTLVSEISNWKQAYLLQSPVEGEVSFFHIWTENQLIHPGDALFAIIPDQEQQFIGKCQLPISNSGKLTVGQTVNIKLDNYPHAENGILKGLVANISGVPNQDMYAVDIALPEGLTTSYHKTLPYQEQMKGQAEIITQRLSVMDRIFFQLRKMTRR